MKHKATILVVDDRENVAKTLRMLLESWGYTAVTAFKLRTGLRRLGPAELLEPAQKHGTDFPVLAKPIPPALCHRVPSSAVWLGQGCWRMLSSRRPLCRQSEIYARQGMELEQLRTGQEISVVIPALVGGSWTHLSHREVTLA